MTRFTLIFIGICLFIAGFLTRLELFPTYNPVTSTRFEGTLAVCTPKIIYDGDTLGCDFDGDGKVTRQEEHVRFIGIDATEMHYSPKNHTGKDEPYALPAKQLVERLTLNRPIYLEYDQTRFDKYDRTLAYIYLDPQRKTMLNRILLAKGLARTMFIGRNLRYKADFIHLQEQAQAQYLNLWS
jgi:micrococcal nuclease